MGEVPAPGLQIGQRPFYSTGMDYFGPMEVKLGRRKEKRYGVIFTCLTTRAVHIEIASSLSTDSCIMAIQRFMGRRGHPAELLSDNGTNFWGAEKELREALRTLDSKKMQTTLTNEGIVWKFNPPGAPHMGGCWERLIRSIETSLRVTLKERVPTQEVLYTLLIEAESILNNRPLTYLSYNKDDPPLTQNHFLLGRPDAIAAPGSFTNSKWCTRKHWKTAQRLTDHFWARWVKKYMPVLTRRVKWCQKVDRSNSSFSGPNLP